MPVTLFVMAWEVWKEVLLPGRQRDRHGNEFRITTRDVAQADRNVGRMLSRGVPLPCVWEHVGVEAASSDARKAAYAKYTFGHVAGRRVDPARQSLWLKLRGEDERDRDQLVKTRFVSPKVCPGYSDSRGGEYRGATIAHVAATPTPVQFWQKPFELSRGEPLYLSFQPEDGTMADETDKPADNTAAGGGGRLKGVIDALREYGLTIPDEVADETGLVIAIKAAKPAADTGDDFDDDLGDAPADDTTAAPSPAGAGGMLMSDARAEPLRKYSRKELTARVKSLFSSGRVDKPTAQSLVRQIKAVDLSYTRDGEMVPNKLATRIEVLEEMPAHSAWKPDGRPGARDLSVTEIDAPDLLTGAGKSGVQEATDLLLSRIAGPAPKK